MPPMISIIGTTDSITVTGHAGYAPSGQDIVCAGVSTLIQTLIQSVEELTTDKIQYDMQPGAVHIKFWCLSDLTKGLVDAFFIGVKLIADTYPDNVKIVKKAE
jgi:uncharacterized protein YsxB (DUF464 family)